jgi:predicted dehydrogenase
MKPANKTTRRAFLKQSALLAGMPMIIPSSALGLNGTTAPSNRIVLGGIGLGPRGRMVLDAFLEHSDCQFVAIADPQKERREIIQRLMFKQYETKDCAAYAEMSGVFERADIDAVIIATGDRWHATASIYAARAGKDVYCEKPCAMNIQECRELDEEFRKHQRVFQAGTQRRNVQNFALAVELARSGKLGKLKAVHAGILELQNYRDPLPAEPEPDPGIINWDQWLGPAPRIPFNRDYCRGKWRNHQGLYAAWRLPEWGSHTVDLCQWAADTDGTAPVDYEADGSTIHCTYANGIKLVMRLSGFHDEGDWTKGLGSCPVRFEGEDGWVEAGDFQRIEVSDPRLIEGRAYDKLRGTDPVDHARNFLDCVKSRKPPVCNSTVTRYGHQACFAAAASWKLGRRLGFDPATETFPHDDEANAMSFYTRRSPYTI